MTASVIEPVKKPVKTFQNKEEFDLYYSKHKEEMEKLTTHMLNRMYTIEGYHITRKKGIEGLCLKSWNGSRYLKDTDIGKLDCALSLAEKVDEVNEKVEMCFKGLNVLREHTTEIDEDLGSLQNDIEMVKAKPTESKDAQAIPKITKDIELLTKHVDCIQKQLDNILRFLKGDTSSPLSPFK
jgi:archaellum component FlaC